MESVNVFECTLLNFKPSTFNHLIFKLKLNYDMTRSLTSSLTDNDTLSAISDDTILLNLKEAS